MPLLRKPVLLPVEGLDYSAPATFINDRAGFPQNMRAYRNELRKRPGITKYGTAAAADASQIMGLGKLELNTGSTYLVRTSKKKTEYYNAAANLWTSISGSDWTGGDDDFHSFTTCSENGLLIITNGISGVRKWTGTGNNAALGGNPPKAKYCAYLSPYLLLAHTDDGAAINPWEVAWPDTGNPELWTGGNSGSEVLADEPSPIRNIMKLNEYAAVYKENSLWIGRKLVSSDIFDFSCIRSGIGLSAPRAVEDVEGVHYFMSANDFYRWNGSSLESIGSPIRDEVFSTISRDHIYRCFSIHVQELNEVWFYIIVAGEDWPTRIWKYNYRNGFWYYDTCNKISAAIRWQRTSTATWDEDVGNWDEAIDIWDTGIESKNWEEIILGGNTGWTYSLDYNSVNDDGTAVDAYFITKDFIADKLEYKKRWLQLDIWARGIGTVRVYYSTDYGETWTYITSHTLTETYQKKECYFDILAESIRFKFQNAVLGETFYLRNFYPYYLSREEVKG